MKLKKIIIYVASTIAVYAVLGFLILPIVIKDQVQKQVNNNINGYFEFKTIEFNPFGFSFALNDLTIKQDKEPSIEIRRVHADIAVFKTLSRGYLHINEIRLTNPSINITQDEQGQLNLQRLAKAQTKPKESQQNNSEFPYFRIYKTAIENANFSFKTFDSKPTEKLMVKDFNYTFYDLGHYERAIASHTMDTKINEHTSLNIKGGLDLKPFRIYGTVKLESFRPIEYMHLLKDHINFELKDAKLDLNFGYQLDLDPRLQLKISEAKLSLSDLKLDHNNKTILSLPKLELNDLNLDYQKKQITIKEIDLKALKLLALKDKNGQLNLQKLLKNNVAEQKETQPKQPEQKESKNEWVVLINNTNVGIQSLDFKDQKTAQQIALKGTNISVEALKLYEKNIEIDKLNLSKEQLQLAQKGLKLTTNPSSLTVNRIKLSPSVQTINDFFFNLKGLELQQSQQKLILKSKAITAKAKSLRYQNNLEIKTLSLEDKDINLSINNKVLIASKNAKLNVEDFKLNKEALQINELGLKHQLISLLNKNVNQTELKNIDLLIRSLKADSKSLSIKNINLNRPIAEITLFAQGEQKGKTEASSSKKKEELRLDIGPIKIKKAKLKFEDKNLPIPFTTQISALDGTINSLNSLSSKPSKLTLEGKVDQYGYTKITGLVDHANIKKLTDVNLLFKNIAIKNFTPYSGKFVGRELLAGKLNLDLRYNIKQSNLDAKNSILISQIKLGKKVQSDTAVSLPLELGIALLEDSNGVIDLNIPISGNVDDPKFSIAPIVWKAFTNLLIKAVTSPFSFLASLLGLEGDELKTAEFAFGNANALPYTNEKLDHLIKALEKRPNIKLQITPTYHQTKDYRELQTLQYDEFIEKALKDNKDNNAYLELLEKEFENKYPKQELKKLRETYTENKKFNQAQYLAYLKEQLELKEIISEQKLNALAQQRVQNVINYFTQRKISKDRLSLLETKVLSDPKLNDNPVEFKIGL